MNKRLLRLFKRSSTPAHPQRDTGTRSTVFYDLGPNVATTHGYSDRVGEVRLSTAKAAQLAVYPNVFTTP